MVDYSCLEGETPSDSILRTCAVQIVSAEEVANIESGRSSIAMIIEGSYGTEKERVSNAVSRAALPSLKRQLPLTTFNAREVEG